MTRIFPVAFAQSDLSSYFSVSHWKTRKTSNKGKMSRLTSGMIVLILSCSFAATQPSQGKLPEGAGKEATERVCGACHSIETVVTERHTKPEWQKISDDMAARGADATDSEMKAIVEYLTKNYAPKN
jgi:cytochrome c5